MTSANEPALARAGTPAVRKLEVLAPLSGVIVPLESVPDPVFAGRLVGDGVAIDPTSTEVLAPFAGVLSQLHDSHHAIAVTADNGVEVLIHVGLDTVSLRGRGFIPLVARGARVTRGQALLRFDPELLARQARSLLTEVIVTTPGKVARLTASKGTVNAGANTLLSLELTAVAAPVLVAVPGETVTSEPIRLPNAEGLHARPAAVLANEARKFTSEIRLVHGDDAANARSVVAVMGLSTRQGQLVRIVATGEDARAAVATLSKLVQDGCGEKPGELPRPVSPQAPLRAQAAQAQQKTNAPSADELVGAPASPGLAIGRVMQHRGRAIVVPEVGGTPEQERQRLASAMKTVSAQLEALRRHGDAFQAQIIGVQISLLEDPDLDELAEQWLEQGKSAPFAWQQAFQAHASRLEKLENPLLRERASDVRDVGRRLLGLLAGTRELTLDLPPQTILIAEEVTPSEMAALDRTRLVGLCTTAGSSTSHVAILARSMGIPAVSGADERVLSLANGDQVVLDGHRGVLRVRPDAALLEKAAAQIKSDALRYQHEQATAAADARTRDGHRVHVVANVGTVEDAQKAAAARAEGIGLLRSEFLFQDRTTPPTEDDQALLYGTIAGTVAPGRPLVIRTLDVGGDKPPAWLPLPREQNPFLGLRGIRVSFAWPDLFREQLRAILRAAKGSAGASVQVMFPMVASVEELRAARSFLAEEQARVPATVEVGVMIEVPSAVLMAAELAREVDFLSIGTNDLTQYVLAMDRGHPKLARLADGLHPAVLRMIDLTVQGAKKHKKRVAVCGGLASAPLAVPLLVGLGVDELSVSVPAVATVKAALARWTLDDCRALAAEALRQETTAEVRALLADQAEAHAAEG
ncbi:MAG: phosphoenolpyruvate--protein phosphotransferase [Deltaproteobacteria bacterium]|nr:phosphoenolpyruvate--protein phosphotransferase [Deltaproteobacteria bacterium]